MRFVTRTRVCPETFKTYGPACIVFNWDITNVEPLYAWLEDHYKDHDSMRLQVCSDRMIRYPTMWAYFDSEEDAMLFKLTWGGK